MSDDRECATCHSANDDDDKKPRKKKRGETESGNVSGYEKVKGLVHTLQRRALSLSDIHNGRRRRQLDPSPAHYHRPAPTPPLIHRHSATR